jgi:hypothetical protein
VRDNSGSSGAWRNIRAALIVAGVLVCGALVLTLSRRQGLIDENIAKRGVMMLIGLGIAAYGNWMPKMLEGPSPQTLAVAELRYAIHRVGGWAMTLGGLGFSGMWAFAPRDVAPLYSAVSAAAGVAVMFGYFVWRAVTHDLRLRRRRRTDAA